MPSECCGIWLESAASCTSLGIKHLAALSLATTKISAEVDLKAKEEAMKSTCPGDAGAKPRWKARDDLLEQLKAI